MPPEPYRKTTQPLAPLHDSPPPSGQYNIYPSFPIGPGTIHAGFDALVEVIVQSHRPAIVLDGFTGVLWDEVVRKLEEAFSRRRTKIRWTDVRTAYRSDAEIGRLIAPFLGGEDPLFGTRCPLSLTAFLDPRQLQQLRPDISGDINILFGPGSALAEWDAFLVYIDIPKNEVQFRSRAGSIRNLGATRPGTPGEMYKRFYFVDWPVLNRHRAAILDRIDCFVDHQRPDEPVIMSGNDVRDGLKKMAATCFRARPWFEPGPWGGQWIKRNVPGVAQDVPNYAWSFELISPENGLAFSSNGLLFELSFDFLMFHCHREILGRFADRFGYEFPIRYDFLDTFDGGNLSVQCHPRPDYVHRHFGETFTQDECYYILDCTPDAHVYLGFREEADVTRFRSELEQSYRQSTPVDIDAFVNSLPAHMHDLFLIPHGTIHCSGKNNLVLEISATPYIFTFKMYDWLRMNLDGNPRTLNIDRAFENLFFERRGNVIRQQHVAHPHVLREGPDWRVVHLPTHPLHFYDVHRLEFTSSIDVATEGSVHVLNLVEGTSIIIDSNGVQMPVNYAETFVVPAAAGSYRLLNRGPQRAFVVKTFLKPDARPYAAPEGAESRPVRNEEP